MTNKVYILQDMPRHDYTPAEKYGNIVFVGKNDINSKFGLFGTPHNEKVVLDVVNVLTDFLPGDYLVVDGNPVMVALAIHYLVEVLRVDVALLKWDNREHGYVTLNYPANFLDMAHRQLDGDKE